MDVKFGASPIAWSNDDLPSLGGDTPLEQCLAEVQEAGYDGVELGGKFPRDVATLAPLLKRYELELVSGWFSGLLAQHGDLSVERERIAAHADLLAQMGCSVLVYADVSGSIQGVRDSALENSPQLDKQRWAAYGAHLTALAEDLTGRGLTMAYHHHMGTFVEKEDALQALLAATGESVKLTLDTGHAAMAGIDPASVIERYPSRIAHVHCKDYRAEVVARVWREKMSFLDGVMAGMFTVPGDGAIDYAPIAQALRAHDYSGWIVVEAEQDPAIAEPLAYARAGLEHLKGVLL